jgi:hypothetical protein
MQVEKQNDEASADEIEVVVEETPPKPDGATETDSGDRESEAPAQQAEGGDDELHQYSDKVQKRIAKLTGRLREAERREQAAIEYAKSLKVENDRSSQNLQFLSSAHLHEYGERLKAQEVLLNSTLKSAIDNGNTDRQIEAQKALADLALDKQRFQQMDRQRQNAARQQEAAPPPQPPQQQMQPAPQPDPKAEAWAQRNDWFGKDEAMTLTAFSIHKKLVENEGFDPTSDEYYGELDKRVRSEFPHKFRREAAAPPPTTVAPAVRTVQAGVKQTTQVRLTPSQVAIAKKLGVSLEQYARQVAKLNAREG